METINIVSAALAPTIAIVGLAFTYFQWKTSEQSRQNALFDRRYEFYCRIREAYLSQHNPNTPPLDIEDWIPLSEEAGFLFGDEIEDLILSLPDRPLEGSSFFPNEWFVSPFRKYLRL